MTDLEHRTGDGHGSGGPAGELATIDDARFPVPDPGDPEHLPRLTDVDEDAADRATRQVATMFGLVPILALIFVVSYFAIPEGPPTSTSARCTPTCRTWCSASPSVWRCVLIGVGAIQWARQLMDDHEEVDYRHGARPATRRTRVDLDELEQGHRRVEDHPPQGARSQPARRARPGGAAGCRAAGRPRAVADPEVDLGDDRDDDLEGGHPAGQRRHLRADQGRAGPDRPAGQRPAGEPAGIPRDRVPGGEGQGLHHRRADEPEHDQDPRLAQGLARRRHPLLLQDLHPRRVPDQPVGTADPPPAVPLPPVDVRPGRLRGGGLRTRRPVAAPAADHGRRRGVSGLPGRLQRADRARATSSGTPATITKQGEN